MGPHGNCAHAYAICARDPRDMASTCTVTSHDQASTSVPWTLAHLPPTPASVPRTVSSRYQLRARIPPPFCPNVSLSVWGDAGT